MQGKLYISTDGGARGNPGPAAIGVYIHNGENKTILALGEKIGVATNNVAEYMAVVKALTFLNEKKDDFKDLSEISFALDSQLVCFQIQGKYKVKNKTLISLLHQVQTLRKMIGFPIYFRHVRRSENRQADLLVNMALDNTL